MSPPVLHGYNSNENLISISIYDRIVGNGRFPHSVGEMSATQTKGDGFVKATVPLNLLKPYGTLKSVPYVTQ